MTALAARTDLTLADSARMMREAVKDRSYRATPLGLVVARYYRWKKNEWGATKETLRDYEAVLAKTAVFFADLELADLEPPVGTERLRECWDFYWGERTARTRGKVLSIWNDFFKWAKDERLMHDSPSAQLRRPKTRDVQREGFTQSLVDTVIASQTYLADRLGCILILQYALRRGELLGVQMKDFDFERKRLSILGKGGKFRLVPLIDPHFWRDLEALKLEAGLAPESYLLYSRDTRKRIVPVSQATEILDVPGRGRTGYADVTTVNHGRQLGGSAAHRWWYRCLTRAGVVAEGVTAGENMHRGRHTVATDILRKSGNIVAASKMLGHESIETTVRAYARFDDSDLARVLASLYGEGDEV